MSEIDNLASALSTLTIWSELWALYKALIYMFCIYHVSLFPDFCFVTIIFFLLLNDHSKESHWYLNSHFADGS